MLVVLKCFCDDKMIIYNISILFYKLIIVWGNCMEYFIVVLLYFN